MVAMYPHVSSIAYYNNKHFINKQARFRLLVPKHLHSAIVGRNGATLRQIEEQSGAEILIPKKESKEDHVELRGTTRQVDLACHYIADVLHEREVC